MNAHRCEKLHLFSWTSKLRRVVLRVMCELVMERCVSAGAWCPCTQDNPWIEIQFGLCTCVMWNLLKPV